MEKNVKAIKKRFSIQWKYQAMEISECVWYAMSFESKSTVSCSLICELGERKLMYWSQLILHTNSLKEFFPNRCVFFSCGSLANYNDWENINLTTQSRVLFDAHILFLLSFQTPAHLNNANNFHRENDELSVDISKSSAAIN